jgi:uncharacterized protein (DUF58 family)
LRLDFPEKVHVAKHREETLDFGVRDEQRAGGTFVIGLGLPREITSPWGEFRAVLPPSDAALKVRWPITATRRGEYHLPECCFRVPSRLGLWVRQGSLAAGTRIRVYPDLRREYRKLAALLLHRSELGRHAQRQVGRGRDFEKLRDYLPGDSMSDIHWRVTAKRGHLVTKEYQIERTQEIYVVIDASRLSLRTVDQQESGPEPLIERYISAALTLGTVAQRQGDRFGLLVFNHRILNFIRAKAGAAHFRVCRNALLDLHAETVTPDFEELAGFILQKLRRRALLLFLTSLDDPVLAESFVHCLAPVSRRHLVYVNMVRPVLAEPVFANAAVADLDDIYRHLGGHLLWQGLRDLETLLKHSGIAFSLVDHERLSVEMVSQYITAKRRQVL